AAGEVVAEGADRAHVESALLVRVDGQESHVGVPRVVVEAGALVRARNARRENNPPVAPAIDAALDRTRQRHAPGEAATAHDEGRISRPKVDGWPGRRRTAEQTARTTRTRHQRRQCAGIVATVELAPGSACGRSHGSGRQRHAPAYGAAGPQ